MKNWLLKTTFAWLALGFISLQAEGPEKTPSEPMTKLYIISPKDGKTVKGNFRVRFGLKGMGIAPAGVKFPKTGHHHLIIDSKLPDLSKTVPNDEKHMHCGGGQTEVRLKLSPGLHTLQLLLAYHNHMPHNPPVISKMIKIKVGK